MKTILSVVQSLRTGKVLLRGEEITIRALAERDIAALDRCFPEPTAPLVKNPAAGSLSLPIENPNDPDWKRELGRWRRRRWLHEVIVSTGSWPEGCPTFGPDQDDATNRKALEAAESAVAAVLTETELFRIWNTIRDLFDEQAHAKARAALVVDLTGETLDIREAEQLPEKYGETIACRQMRAFERFGQIPQAVDPGLMVMMIEYDTFRRQEEARIMAGA